MSKNKTIETTAVVTTPPPATETPPAASQPETALAVAAPAQVTAVAVATAETWQSKLADRMKLAPTDPVREDILSLRQPAASEFMALVESFPAEKRSNVLNLIGRMKPKQGDHSSKTGFSPMPLKLYQGTGDDPNRPSDCPVGTFYAPFTKMGSSFKGLVLGVIQGRTLWPPRDEGKAPVCSSVDRVTGSKYGSCQTCAYSSKKTTEGGCGSDTVVYLLDQNLTGIYELRFMSTSAPAGNTLVKALKNANTLWGYWVTFSNEKRTNGDKKWHILKAEPVMDHNEAPPAYLDPLCSLFSQLIDALIYWPQRAMVMERLSSNALSGGVAEADTFTLKELTTPGGNSTSSKDEPTF
jgi:hypothetical protein